MSEIRTNKIANTAGVEQYLAKAWVNFNGTGTVAIRAAGNVASITDNGVGDYTVNFTTAIADANYSLLGTTEPSITAAEVVGIKPGVAPTTTAANIIVHRGGVGNVDAPRVMLAIFR